VGAPLKRNLSSDALGYGYFNKPSRPLPPGYDETKVEPEADSETWGSLLYDFTQNTTFHGVRYIPQPTVFLVRRILWIAVVLTSTCFFCNIVYNRLFTYFEYNTIVNVQVESASSLKFPAVTICNHNFLRGSEVYKTGMFDEISSRFKAIQAGYSEVRPCTVQNPFTLLPNKTVSISNFVELEKHEVATFIGLTLEVCKYLCVKDTKLKCKSIFYSKAQASCSITSIETDDFELAESSTEDIFFRCRVCGKDEFECDNGDCIPESLVCNGMSNCDDGSDEINQCWEDCEFNYDNLCGFSIEPKQSELYTWMLMDEDKENEIFKDDIMCNVIGSESNKYGLECVSYDYDDSSYYSSPYASTTSPYGASGESYGECCSSYPTDPSYENAGSSGGYPPPEDQTSYSVIVDVFFTPPFPETTNTGATGST
ncbi:unnamed protein product, partial [Owenia fusiformis]